MFHTDAKSIRQVENKVESDLIQLLRRRCNAERSQKKMMVDAANQHTGAEKEKLLQRADKMTMRYCDQKDRLDAFRH